MFLTRRKLRFGGREVDSRGPTQQRSCRLAIRVPYTFASLGIYSTRRKLEREGELTVSAGVGEGPIGDDGPTVISTIVLLPLLLSPTGREPCRDDA